ncbi:unnamed protein product, partial [Meganyctiphanes norvegica]
MSVTLNANILFSPKKPKGLIMEIQSILENIIKQDLARRRKTANNMKTSLPKPRTIKLLSDYCTCSSRFAVLAASKWLLYPRYIHDCFKKKMWLDEHDYELPNYNFAARHHRMARVNRAGAGLYKNIRVYIKLAQKSHTRAFRRVMAAGEADIVLKEGIHSANLVITDMQHYEIIAQQMPANSAIVKVDYIKDTLIHEPRFEGVSSD